MTEEFYFFWKNGLSQWKNSPMVDNGIVFSTCEQYMMYHKALLFNDKSTAEVILQTKDPSKCKKLGRLVCGFNEALWNMSRMKIVVDANLIKFRQNDELRKLLFSTQGKTLVEASPFDKIWGIALEASDPRALDRAKWKGQNLLGQCLMIVRDTLLKQTMPARLLKEEMTIKPLSEFADDYVSFSCSDKFCDDNDYNVYALELIVEAFYGKDIFNKIREYRSQ